MRLIDDINHIFGAFGDGQGGMVCFYCGRHCFAKQTELFLNGCLRDRFVQEAGNAKIELSCLRFAVGRGGRHHGSRSGEDVLCHEESAAGCQGQSAKEAEEVNC